MKILVTGAAGFIASHTSQLLLREGHEVVGLDNLNDAYDPALKRWRLDGLVSTPGFRFLRGDVASRADVERAFAEGPFDGVLHLAARAGVRQSLEDPWVYLETNGVGTLNVLDAMRRHGTKRILVASTSSLYGDGKVRPYREEADTEHPRSPYAASKKAAESMTAAYAHLYGLDATVARYFTVYGPAGRPDMSIFRFIRWIAQGTPVTVYGDGTQERDFTFVRDVARGNLLALQKLRGFNVVNFGNDDPVQLNHVLALIEERLGKKASIVRKPMAATEVMATWADITKARSDLGWKPETSIAEGIAASVAWYLENKDWADKLDLGRV